MYIGKARLSQPKSSKPAHKTKGGLFKEQDTAATTVTAADASTLAIVLNSCAMSLNLSMSLRQKCFHHGVSGPAWCVDVCVNTYLKVP